MQSGPAADLGVGAVGEPPVASPVAKTREEIRDAIRPSAWYQDLQTPKIGPGDPAPDFSLPVLDANRGLTSQFVRLSDYAGTQPVALIFGSYT